MKARSGFTLIEMLLTLGVLALGLTVLFSLLPAEAAKSRKNRDIQRIGVFADDVFASLAWSFEQPTDGTGATIEDTWKLQSVAVPQLLVESEAEVPFPKLENTFSPLTYSLTLTRSELRVDAVLRVHTKSLGEPSETREFTRSFSRERRPW